MACDDHLCRFYLTQWRRIVDDPQTKGSLALRESELGSANPRIFLKSPMYYMHYVDTLYAYLTVLLTTSMTCSSPSSDITTGGVSRRLSENG